MKYHIKFNYNQLQVNTKSNTNQMSKTLHCVLFHVKINYVFN